MRRVLLYGINAEVRKAFAVEAAGVCEKLNASALTLPYTIASTIWPRSAYIAPRRVWCLGHQGLTAEDSQFYCASATYNLHAAGTLEGTTSNMHSAGHWSIRKVVALQVCSVLCGVVEGRD